VLSPLLGNVYLHYVLDVPRPPREQSGGKGPSTFDFLGFTVYWRRTKTGRWGMA
jgi:hypothetical protein